MRNLEYLKCGIIRSNYTSDIAIILKSCKKLVTLNFSELLGDIFE